MNIFDALEEVHDRASFVRWVEALIEDRKIAARLENERPQYYSLSGANDWQNGTIEDYLEAALSCVEDNLPQRELMSEPSWRSLANFLYAGKIYE